MKSGTEPFIVLFAGVLFLVGTLIIHGTNSGLATWWPLIVIAVGVIMLYRRG